MAARFVTISLVTKRATKVLLLDIATAVSGGNTSGQASSSPFTPLPPVASLPGPDRLAVVTSRLGSYKTSLCL